MTAPVLDLTNPSIQADAIRVCRLNTDGTPIYASDTGAYANYAFVTVDAKPAIETANEFVQRSADGTIFIDYRDDDKIKWVELTMTIQYPDAALMELIENGAILLDSTGGALGYEAAPLASNTNSNPVSLEVWSKAPVGILQSGTYQWYRWLFPYTRGWHRSDISYKNDVQEFTYDGYAMESTNFGVGSFKTWTDDETTGGTALDATRAWEWIASQSLPPALAPGYLTTPAAPS